MNAVEAANELRTIVAEEKRLSSRKDELKRIIREATPVGDSVIDKETGEILAVVKPGQRRWSADSAKSNLPDNVYKSILTLQPDKVIAKEILAPALYEACCVETDPMVYSK
jgi:hypothetical protein